MKEREREKGVERETERGSENEREMGGERRREEERKRERFLNIIYQSTAKVIQGRKKKRVKRERDGNPGLDF